MKVSKAVWFELEYLATVRFKWFRHSIKFGFKRLEFDTPEPNHYRELDTSRHGGARYYNKHVASAVPTRGLRHMEKDQNPSGGGYCQCDYERGLVSHGISYLY